MRFSIQNGSTLPVAGLAAAGLLCALPVAANAGQVVILPGYELTETVVASARGVPSDFQTANSFGAFGDSLASPVGTIAAGSALNVASAHGAPGAVLSAQTQIMLDANTITPPNIPLVPVLTAAGGYNGELKYYFEVTGPGATAPIRITDVGKLRIAASTAGDIASATVNLDIASVGNPGAGLGSVVHEHSAGEIYEGALLFGTPEITGTIAGGLVGGFKSDGVYNLGTNVVYMVDMEIQTGGHVDGRGGTADAYAYLDPFFSIAPGTPNADAYSLHFSDGIGNTPPVVGGGAPEPAAWAMMLMGFAGVGAALRGRRASARLEA